MIKEGILEQDAKRLCREHDQKKLLVVVVVMMILSQELKPTVPQVWFFGWWMENDGTKGCLGCIFFNSNPDFWPYLGMDSKSNCLCPMDIGEGFIRLLGGGSQHIDHVRAIYVHTDRCDRFTWFNPYLHALTYLIGILDYCFVDICGENMIVKHTMRLDIHIHTYYSTFLRVVWETSA